MRFFTYIISSFILTLSTINILAQCDFTATTLVKPFSCLIAEDEVVFTNISSGMNVTGNDLDKTGANGWNGGASSVNTVDDHGYVSTVVNEVNTNRMIGLSNVDLNSNYTSIEYAFYLRSDGSLRIYESGVNLGTFGTYENGDEVKIRIEDNVVRYYINDNLLHTSSVVPTLPMIVDVSLNTTGSTLQDVKIGNGTDGTFTSSITNAGTGETYQWKLNGSNVGTSSSTYTNAGIVDGDVVQCEITVGAGGCTVGTVISNSIQIIESTSTDLTSINISNTAIDSKCNRASVAASFSSLTADIIASGNDIVKSGSNTWNSCAFSAQSINDNGYIFTVVNETSTNRMFGLNDTFGSSSYTDIDFAINLNNNGYVYIYESGSSQGQFGTYSSGDTAKVVAEDGIVSYYINSNLIYTSAVVPSFPLYADMSIYTDGGTLEEITLVSGTGGDFTANVSNVGASPTYQWKLNGVNVGANSPNYSNASLAENDEVTCEITPDITGCISTPIVSNTITYIEEDPTANTLVSIYSTATDSKCNRAVSVASFVSASSTLEINSNKLTKNGSNGWNAGAFTAQSISDNGYIYSVVNETSTSRAIGLNATNTNTSYNDIDYAINLNNNGYVYVYENGSSQGQFGTYSSGDTAKVVAEDGVVSYYINSNLIYSSAVAPTFPLYGDMSINTDGGTLEEITLVSGTAGDFTAVASNAGTSPSYQWKLNGSNVGTDSPNYSNASLVVDDVVTCEVTPDVSGCAVTPILSNAITYTEEDPTANTLVSIYTSATDSKCERAISVAGFASASGTLEINANNLTKNGSNGWNAGAFTSQSISDNGYIYSVINETSTTRAFGLNTSNTNTSYSDIDYALMLMNNARVRVYENNSYIGEFGGYSSGDTAKVVAEDGVISYYINSNLIYTSAVVPSFPLYADVSINTDGGTLEELTLVSGTAGDFTAVASNAGTSPSYQWKLNGSNVGTDSPNYSNASLAIDDVVTCEVTPDVSGCAVSPIASNTITYAEENPSLNSKVSIYTIPTDSKCDRAYSVAGFLSLSGTLAATDNNIVKSGTNAWDAGAVSVQSIDDNGYVFTVVNETNTRRMFGLNNSNTTSSYSDIDYAIDLRNNGYVYVFENGSNIGQFGTYLSGDTVRIIVEDEVVSYYINSNLIYTSLNMPTLPLYVDMSLYTDGATIEDINLVSGTSGDFVAEVLNVGTNPTYQWKLNGLNVGSNSANYSNASLAVNDVVTCEVTPDVSGCTVTAVLSNTITYLEEDPQANSTVSISAVPTSSKCSKLHAEARFTALSSTSVASGNDITKSGSNGWNTSANSFQTIDDNGYAYTVVQETNKNRMFGLNNNNTSSSYTDIDYAIYLRSNGIAAIYENGSYIGDFGTYLTGDTAKVSVEDGVVSYYLNSQLLYTSTVSPTLPLFVDLSINTNGGTLKNINLVSGTGGDFVAVVEHCGSNPSYQWKLNGANVGANSPNYSNASLAVSDVVTCEVTPDLTGCTASPITSNSTYYFEENPTVNTSVYIYSDPTSSRCNRILTEARFTNVGSNIEVTDNNVTKNGSNGWNCGAASVQQVNDNGFIYTVVDETNTERAFGLNSSNTSVSYTDIDFAINLRNDGTIRIYENGSLIGSYGSYTTGDTLKVLSLDNVIYYYKNSIVLYTSVNVPTFPMVADLALNTNGATLKDIYLLSGTEGDYSCTVLSGGTSPAYQWKLNGANVGTNSSTYSNINITTGDVLTCEVTPDVPGCTSTPFTSNTITMILEDKVSEWNGGNTDWFDGGNWSNGVPNELINATILSSASTMPIINGADATTKSLSIESGASLTISSTETLEIYGNLDNQGTMSLNSSTIIFNTNCDGNTATIDLNGAQDFNDIIVQNPNNIEISSGSINLYGGLKLSIGNFETNNSLTIISDINGTGRIDEIESSASISGNVTMQRYIPAGATNWRLLSSPISGATLADWNDDFITSGFTGSDYPSFSFVSMYTYDETVLGDKDNGWTAPTNITNSINDADGIYVWCGDALTTTSAFTIDVNGTPNTGTIIKNLTYTDDISQPFDEDGWNLIGNPYPAPVDFSNLTLVNTTDAYFIRDPQSGNMETWDESTSLSSLGLADGNIASSQGFWVHAEAIGASITFDEDDKASSSSPIFKSSSVNVSAVGIKIQSNVNSYWDRVILGEIADAEAVLDEWDIFKFYSPSQNAPNIATLTDSFELAMNFYPNFSNQVEIPVKIKTPLAGTYELVIDSISNLSATCLTLIDVLTGTETIITDNFVYSFTSTTEYSGIRFYIINSGTAFATNTNVSCSGDSDGTVEIHASGNGVIDYTLYLDGNLVESISSALSSVLIDSLSPGQYIWTADGQTTCGVAFSRMDTIDILEGLSLNADFNMDEDTVYLINSEATVTFTNTSSGAGNISWDFGDENTSTGSFATHTYTVAGTYTVTMTIDNGICSETANYSVVVNSDDASNISELDQNLWLTVNKGSVTITSSAEMISSIYLVDINGKLLGLQVGNSNSLTIPTKDISEGIYFLRVSLANGNVEVIKWKK
ncbi:MAG: PKD domain-containing protein [Flavobacteriales bacterium]|nr:PKD domain-containing protein [Flavobacteriales bacterium]MCB9197977.1 PKD domain-containing protein [Flavobacteriales bacterium]